MKKTTDIRIAQYESGTHTPKEEMLKKMAEVLDVNYRAIYEPTLYAAEDIMYNLFELDEDYNLKINEVEDENNSSKQMAVSFDSVLMNDFLKEWQQYKKDLINGEISKADYNERKVNWPLTCDGAGKFEAKKKWRKCIGGDSNEK